MQQIRITRDSSGNVQFETVSIDNTENVFFINLDPQAPHWPEIASNKLGPWPSLPSSQCHPKSPYGCKIAGHENEQGIINIFEPLAETNTKLKDATKGQPITQQQVVKGGMSPYQITGELFEVKDSNNTVIQSGLGIGPGLQLIPKMDHTGIYVSGTPTLSGTYIFTFMVDDAMGWNLQQAQYSMKVAEPARRGGSSARRKG
jgi:hypothetical protein